MPAPRKPKGGAPKEPAVDDHQRLKTLLEALPDPVFFKDGEGRLRLANGVALEVFGLGRVAWQGKTDLELAALLPDRAQALAVCHSQDQLAWEKGDRHDSLERVPTADGLNLLSYDVTRVPLFNPDGSRQAMVVVGRDCTARRALEEVELRQRNSLRHLNEIAAFAQLSLAEQFRRALTIGAAHLGLEFGLIVAVEGTEGRLASHVSPPGVLAEDLRLPLAHTYCSITLAQGDVLALRQTGLTVYRDHPAYAHLGFEAYIGVPVLVQGRIYGVVSFASVYPYKRDFDEGDREFLNLLGRWVGTAIERQQWEEEVRQLAYYDSLTGLPNRRLLLDRLELALAQARRQKRALAVMFLDLDNFKQVNDALGHDAGDQLLREVARRLKACVREGDTVARQGGDEFIIVLSEIGAPEDAVRVAEKIRDALVRPIAAGGDYRVTTVSIGIAIRPRHGRDGVPELMKKADEAMYAAKQGGRDAYRFHP